MPNNKEKISIDILDKNGKKKGKMELPVEIFGVRWNSNAIHQVVCSYMSNSRIPIAHAKARSEVHGGGKKPWKQKGTGRARHGSIRSPIWIGGGVTFGPTKERNFKKKINKKMKRFAFLSVISRKLRDNQIMFFDDLIFENPKTKLVSEFFKVVFPEKRPSILVVSSEKNKSLSLAARNIPKVCIKSSASINIYDCLSYNTVIFEGDSIKSFIERISKKEKED